MDNTYKPHVYCITATCGRHTLLERLVATFMAQDYYGPKTLLIYNNSSVSQSLAGQPFLPRAVWGVDNKYIVLVNNHLDRATGEPYKNLGAIYRDALNEVAEDAKIITHMDDDDIFLPDHISKGVEGFERATSQGLCAYKPERSWFRHSRGLDLMGNNLEPSIFIDSDFLKSFGYSLTTSDQHLEWFVPLLREQKILIDPKGKPTLVYNWGDTTPTFKTSGNAGDPNNFNNYRNFSKDHGDRVISPIPESELKMYYDEVRTALPNKITG